MNPSFPATLPLSGLSTVSGVTLNGFEDKSLSGMSVTGVGDINADGVNDIAVVASQADGGGTDKGQVYIVYGSKAGFPASLNLNALDGTNGFTITGLADGDSLGHLDPTTNDGAGQRGVSGLGDVNGDGVDDFAVGAALAGGAFKGQAYVIFGNKGFAKNFDLRSLDGTTGYTITGANFDNFLGVSVAGGSDLNGDGLNDVIVSAPGAAGGGATRGEVYVVFGSKTNKAALTPVDLDGTIGFSLLGIEDNDKVGASLAGLGDVNGDGVDDLLIGAPFSNSGGFERGAAYVVFGNKAGFAATLKLFDLNGTTGFGILGKTDFEKFGYAVGDGGDFNGDGLADFLVGAPYMGTNGKTDNGRAFLFFGSKTPFTAVVDQTKLDGTNGFFVTGLNNKDGLGATLAGGNDFNSDGLDDIVISAPGANNQVGQTSVIFGSKTAFPADFSPTALTGKNGFRIDGIAEGDASGFGVGVLGDVSGDGVDDLIVGAFIAKSGGTLRGQSYVVFGQATPGRFAVGLGQGGSGSVSVFNPDGSKAYTVDAFPGTSGGARTAMADVNGDGVNDLIVGTGPGSATMVKVYDGKTKTELFSVMPFEAAFTGGVYVSAGDLNNDGKAEIVVTPDQGGGPVVAIYGGAEIAAGKAGDAAQIVRFLGIEDSKFRGGARSAIADVNADGKMDLYIVAGFGGGPRIALFDGASVTVPLGEGKLPPKLRGDFFVFEDTLRNGVFIAGGDLDGDGFAEVVAGGGPGGGPRVLALSGKDILNKTETVIGNFFAGDPALRGGVRVVVKDLDGDNKLDIITGAGDATATRVNAYLGAGLTPSKAPDTILSFDAIADFRNGVFVG